MPRLPVVQQPSTYERVRRRSNALLLTLDPQPIVPHLQEAAEHELLRITVSEVLSDDDGAALQDVYTAIAPSPPPRSPTSGGLMMPLPPGCEGLPHAPRPALRQVPLPPELVGAARAAPCVPSTSRHFGLEVGPSTTRHLQACTGYLNEWLKDGVMPKAMAERIANLRLCAEALTSSDDDLMLMYNVMFCMTLETNRLLSVGRHAVLEDAQGAPATGGMAPAAQMHVLTEVFMRNADSVSAALEIFVDLTESYVIVSRALGSYTQRTGVWAPEPHSGHAPAVFVALHASRQQLLNSLRRLARDLQRWSENIGTQVRLLGCRPPGDIAPGTVFASLRHLQPLGTDVTDQLPYDAMQFNPQTEMAQQLRGYMHYVSECLHRALTCIEADWDTHVARDPAPK